MRIFPYPCRRRPPSRSAMLRHAFCSSHTCAFLKSGTLALRASIAPAWTAGKPGHGKQLIPACRTPCRTDTGSLGKDLPQAVDAVIRFCRQRAGRIGTATRAKKTHARLLGKASSRPLSEKRKSPPSFSASRILSRRDDIPAILLLFPLISAFHT